MIKGDDFKTSFEDKKCEEEGTTGTIRQSNFFLGKKTLSQAKSLQCTVRPKLYPPCTVNVDIATGIVPALAMLLFKI